jgi:hypothetical protein
MVEINFLHSGLLIPQPFRLNRSHSSLTDNIDNPLSVFWLIDHFYFRMRLDSNRLPFFLLFSIIPTSHQPC